MFIISWNVPERFEKIMNHWMEITYDWCISRQLWWGHRIPAWYKGDEVYVGMEAPKEEGWTQDSDVLDTWFSSALWPFSTMGWPEETEDFKRYYPNNILVTGYDIIPFWVNRMTFQGLEFTGQRPFKECLIHGLIRDKQGRKMSKSLGNGVDPMDVIDKYGADSLRFFLSTSVSPGMDLRYDEEKVASTWNFINKLWNASRFVLMNTEGFEPKEMNLEHAELPEKWILTKLNHVIQKVRKHLDTYEFNVVGTEIYNFVWNDFCDWYIELAKTNMDDTKKTTLLYVLEQIVKLLHPFMPYVTEEIYQMLPNHEKSIMISSYPVYHEEQVFEDAEDLDLCIEIITKVRKARLENNVDKNYTLVYQHDFIKEHQSLLQKMLKLDENHMIDTDHFDSDLTSISLAVGDISFVLYYDGSQNEQEKKEQLEKEKTRLEASITRRKKLLSNENYVSKAPAHIVEAERKQLEKEEQELNVILNELH